MDDNKKYDISGQIFGKWTVIEKGEPYRRGKVRWICDCECGAKGLVFGTDLRSGASTQCWGCGRKQVALKSLEHGHALVGKKSKSYIAWTSMKGRCKYHLEYIKRGIKVCDEWLNSFEAFLSHVGEHPGEGYSLDRINNNEGYRPGNVRWATRIEQANNTSANKLITFKGVTKNITQWARIMGIPVPTMRVRFLNWPLEKALESYDKL